jgi:hypothetical protein
MQRVSWQHLFRTHSSSVVLELEDSVQKFVVFSAVTMKNSVLWDIKTKFVPHWKQIISLLKAQPLNAMQDLWYSRR